MLHPSSCKWPRSGSDRVLHTISVSEHEVGFLIRIFFFLNLFFEISHLFSKMQLIQRGILASAFVAEWVPVEIFRHMACLLEPRSNSFKPVHSLVISTLEDEFGANDVVKIT